MTKQEAFLWITQTVVIVNATHLAPRVAAREMYPTECSGFGAFAVMYEAVHVSERIPEDMSVTDAVHDFCAYALRNLREEEQGASGVDDLAPPKWLAEALATMEQTAGLLPQHDASAHAAPAPTR